MLRYGKVYAQIAKLITSKFKPQAIYLCRLVFFVRVQTLFSRKSGIQHPERSNK